MPKSKVRKQPHKQAKVQNRPCPVSHVGAYPVAKSPYIVKPGTLRVGSHTLNVPTPLIVKGKMRSTLSQEWQDSAMGEYVALGGSNHFLATLTEETREVLTECSPNKQANEAYAELFAWGFFALGQLDKAVTRSWLDDKYLGTWEDPTFAMGAFLRDMSGTAGISAEKRRIAYERLAQMAVITEIPLGSGRTIVYLDRTFDDIQRFLANQYMIHGSMPEVIGL